MDRFFIILCVIIALVIIWKISGLLAKLYIKGLRALNDDSEKGADNG